VDSAFCQQWTHKITLVGRSGVSSEACIRCPMLSINPKMLPRLDELEEDLLGRRQRAID
jgi:hypothetical protein